MRSAAPPLAWLELIEGEFRQHMIVAESEGEVNLRRALGKFKDVANRYAGGFALLEADRDHLRHMALQLMLWESGSTPGHGTWRMLAADDCERAAAEAEDPHV